MAELKLANATDFRNAVKDEDCYEPAREILLPESQKVVLLRKPKPLLYTLLQVPLPGLPEENVEPAQAAAESVSSEEQSSMMTPDEKARVAAWAVKLWSKVFVHPRLSLRPGEDEIHPDWIPESDQRFVWKWIRGEVNDSGESLSSFPGGVQA